MNLTRVVRLLNRLCAPDLADSWDNTGLLLEPSAPHEVKNIMITNDLTQPCLIEAKSMQIDLIVSYHPPIFKALKKITQSHWKERLIVNCFENRIAIFSPHTGLDAKQNGINDWLLSPFECSSVKTILPTSKWENNSSTKNMTVKSAQQLEELCGSQNEFYITDMKSASIGKPIKIRCLNSNFLDDLNTCSETDGRFVEGYGRIGTLKEPMSLENVVLSYVKLFGVNHPSLALGEDKLLVDNICTIGVCAGSGASVLSNPVAKAADLFVTGEMSHHDVLEAVSHGISVLTVGHSTSERGYLSGPLLLDLQTLLNMVSPNSVMVHYSKVDREPSEVV